MTIDKKHLVELLVDKTSMNAEEIKNQLDQLIERILDAAKRGKALEIKEFGSFYFDEEGELRFDAAEELSTEISFKYAGMKPVELKPERDTSIPDVEDQMEEDEEEDLFGDPFDEYEAEEEAESGTKKDEETDLEEEENAPFDFDDDSDEEDETNESIIDDPFSSEGIEPLEEPVEKEEETTTIENLKTVPRQPVKRRDNTGIFILIAIVVVAVLVGAYFYYVNTQSQNEADTTQSSTAQVQSGVNENENTDANAESTPAESQPNEGQNAEVTTDPNQALTAEDQTVTEQAVSNQGTEEETVPNASISASETDQPMYGLSGTVIEEANNGYSIVVHSFRTEEVAMEAAAQLRAEGYRVIVSSRTVNENLVWRVSVGQFETLGAAPVSYTHLTLPTIYSV